MNPTEIIKYVRENYVFSEQVQQAITYLKESGYDRQDSMAILKRAYEISFNEAKTLVHRSMAWSADRSAIDKLHERLERDLGSSS